MKINSVFEELRVKRLEVIHNSEIMAILKCPLSVHSGQPATACFAWSFTSYPFALWCFGFHKIYQCCQSSLTSQTTVSVSNTVTHGWPCTTNPNCNATNRNITSLTVTLTLLTFTLLLTNCYAKHTFGCTPCNIIVLFTIINVSSSYVTKSKNIHCHLLNFVWNGKYSESAKISLSFPRIVC